MGRSSTRSPLFAIVGVSAFVGAAILSMPVAADAQNVARIWEDRGPIAQLDLFWGSGNPARVPVGPFTFVSEDLGGTNPKAHVRDANGVRWQVKWDEEVHAEVAATRLAWAMGLRVEETYYVDAGTIVFPGGQRPAFKRIASFIDKQGNFKPARFARMAPEEKTEGTWQFGANPLASEGGYSVLVLMNVIMANWDAKNTNNKRLGVREEAGITDWYMVGDYGACFGKMGGPMSHTKYKLKDFSANPPVVKSVTAERVNLEFKGQNASAHASVPLDGARFFASRAAELSVANVEDAFRAAGANQQEARAFAEAVYGRIREVVTKVQ